MAFVRRKIELSFILGTGSFGTDGEITVKVPEESPNNTATFSNLRVRAHIANSGNVAMGIAQIEVYGLTLSNLNTLSTIAQYAMYARQNKLIITAGDEVDGMGVIFEGTITQAWANLNSVPDSVLHVVANAGAFHMAKPAPPSSYTGTADAAVIMSSLAQQMGYSFENNGVSVILATPYLKGTLWDQAVECAKDANIDWGIDRNVLFITPKGLPRGSAIVEVSAKTGMIGYPVQSSTGTIINMLFNRNINLFNTVEIKSSLVNATGKYRVIAVSHDLESETPGGEWYTHFQGATLGHPNAIPTLK